MRYISTLASLCLALAMVSCGKSQPAAGSKLGTPVLGMSFVQIPAGDFTMGSPASEAGRDADEAQKPAKIGKGFSLATTEVTVGAFAKFIEDQKYVTDAERAGSAMTWRGNRWATQAGLTWKNPGFSQSPDNPVVCVTIRDAAAFCQWLSVKQGGRFRLPTEAEWEYACRAGTQTAYATGASLDPMEKVKSGIPGTRPVGQGKANAWGLFDMHGNAAEWVASSATSPATRPGTGIIRGGSWASSRGEARSANRAWSNESKAFANVGFRIVSEP